MEDTQELHHQQELEQQEQQESKSRQWKRYGTAFRSLIHSDCDTVFINFDAGSMHFAFYLDKKIAKQLGQDLIDHSR
jgi:hypothetical protein